MPTKNPFANDDVLGDVWEQGYLAGFADPEVDHFRPFSPELLDVYHQGEQGGRDDRRRPPSEDGHSWVEVLVEQGVEHGLLHAIGMACEKIVGQIGGLVSLIITVVTIPGDVQLRPIDPDWSGADGEEGDTYVAVCPRTDHQMVMQGVTSDGYWTGFGRAVFGDAASDMKAHGHPESFVARCSLSDESCGPVWPVQ